MHASHHRRCNLQLLQHTHTHNTHTQATVAAVAVDVALVPVVVSNGEFGHLKILLLIEISTQPYHDHLDLQRAASAIFYFKYRLSLSRIRMFPLSFPVRILQPLCVCAKDQKA